MLLSTTRIEREKKTVMLMIQIFCRAHHATQPYHHTLCDECSTLLEYALFRLAKCPFEDQKPTCGCCSIHCYKPEMREKIKTVMRYAGPRMLLKQPFLAINHLFETLKDKTLQKDIQ